MKVSHLTPSRLLAWISVGRKMGAAVCALCIAGGIAGSAHAANITMATANASWLNAATWSDNTAPSAANDYFTAVTGNNFLRTSPAATTAGGNANFTGNSLTVVVGTKLLYKQVGGETASVNGGTGNVTLDGQANAFNGIQFAPNGSQAGTTMIFDVNDLVVASESTIEAGGTTSNATVLIDGSLTGSGNLTLQRQAGGGNDTALNTTISIASVGAYTGNLLVTRDTTLDFNSDHTFAGSLSLTDGPVLLTDLALLNVDQRLEFQSVLGGGTYVAPGSYSGTALTDLNVSLGQTYFVDGGGTLVVRVPEPASIALLGLGIIGLVLKRRS